MINLNLGNHLNEEWINKENKKQSEFEIDYFRFNILSNNKKRINSYFTYHLDYVYSMIILHDGRIATSSEHLEDGSIKIYNIRTNKIDIDIKEANEETMPNILNSYSLLVEDKNNNLISSIFNFIKIWEIKSNKYKLLRKIKIFHCDYSELKFEKFIEKMIIIENNLYILVNYEFVKIWNTNPYEFKKELRYDGEKFIFRKPHFNPDININNIDFVKYTSQILIENGHLLFLNKDNYLIEKKISTLKITSQSTESIDYMDKGRIMVCASFSNIILFDLKYCETIFYIDLKNIYEVDYEAISLLKVLKNGNIIFGTNCGNAFILNKNKNFEYDESINKDLMFGRTIYSIIELDGENIFVCGRVSYIGYFGSENSSLNECMICELEKDFEFINKITLNK